MTEQRDAARSGGSAKVGRRRFGVSAVAGLSPSGWVASGFGAGFSPWAPGTVASLIAAFLGVGFLAVSPWFLALAALLATIGGTTVVARATGLAVRPRGDRPGQHADPGWVVLDEVAGQWIALLALSRPSWLGSALAVLLFRLLDVTKPGPIGWADRQGGAGGIMADDVIAGAIAAAVIGIARWCWPQLL